MSSYVRTVQSREIPEYVDEILNRVDHYLLLKFIPRRASSGDFMYLAYRGELVGRAVIDRLEEVDGIYPIGSKQEDYHARCLVWYRGGWERPPRRIPVRGRQGIRYLEGLGLSELDQEKWS